MELGFRKKVLTDRIQLEHTCQFDERDFKIGVLTRPNGFTDGSVHA